MKYKKNPNLENLELGKEEGLVCFDSESGNTHILDDVAQDILGLFENPLTIDEALKSLSEKYVQELSAIEEDSKDFINRLIQNKLILPVTE